MTTRPARPLLAALLAFAACSSVTAGDFPATLASCEALCAVQAAAPGCTRTTTACDALCTADTLAFTEDCLVKARAYYDCATPLAYTCPGAPDDALTADTTCAAEENAYLVCKVTGE